MLGLIRAIFFDVDESLDPPGQSRSGIADRSPTHIQHLALRPGDCRHLLLG